MRILVLLALIAAPAMAADRTVAIGSVDRLRVDGPFVVGVTTGSPTLRLSGDGAAIAAIEVRQDGGTLTIRRRGGTIDTPATGTAPIRIALATPALAAVTSSAGAEVTIATLRGARVETTVAGAGAITVGAVDATEVAALMAGSGRLTLAGRTAKARFVKNGTGAIDAAGLAAGDVLVAADGIGPLSARARYTAQVSNVGTGQVTIAGSPRCVVRPANGGPVACGKGMAD